MPQTELDGATLFSERLRRRVEQQLPLTVSGGVSAAVEGDNPQTLLARADAALYSAKAAGRNRLFRHTGLIIQAASEVTTEEELAAVEKEIERV
jgi:PleD family two-component response regulator